MDITTKPIAAAMGKGWNGKREVLVRDSFASPTICRLSTAAYVCKVPWQAKGTLAL